MVDAYAAGVAHASAQCREERLEAAGNERTRRERGEAPALAERIERIGRSTDVQADEKVVLARPRVAAAAVHAHREIGDQADPHAGAARLRLRRRQRAVGHPLQEHMEGDLTRMGGGELRDGGSAGVLPLRWPFAPAPCIAVDREAGGMQGLEPCMLLEQIASTLTKSGKIARKRS